MEEKLSTEEVKRLRDMIKREEAVSWLWSWVKSFLFVAAGGVVTIYSAAELVKK